MGLLYLYITNPQQSQRFSAYLASVTVDEYIIVIRTLREIIQQYWTKLSEDAKHSIINLTQELVRKRNPHVEKMYADIFRWAAAGNTTGVNVGVQEHLLTLLENERFDFFVCAHNFA
jgi:endonuclease/exonuclease/phosphatase (EEP) superfamily protein YafD